ncbi:MAG: hypothetical protein ACRCT8_15305 [Lacipirellulaceae bacterium]
MTSPSHSPVRDSVDDLGPPLSPAEKERALTFVASQIHEGVQTDSFAEGEVDELLGDKAEQRKGLELQRVRDNLQAERDEREQRKQFAESLFDLSRRWVIVVILIVVLDATGSAGESSSQPVVWFNVSDSVLIALVGGMTVGVLGFFAAVLGWLFPKR